MLLIIHILTVQIQGHFIPPLFPLTLYQENADFMGFIYNFECKNMRLIVYCDPQKCDEIFIGLTVKDIEFHFPFLQKTIP